MALTITSEIIRGKGERREVTYLVTDSAGPNFEYRLGRVTSKFNVVAYRALLVAKLEGRKQDEELDQWLEETGTVPPLEKAGALRYLSVWQRHFKKSAKGEKWRLGYHMKMSVDRGDFTNPQMRNAWSMTGAELTAFLVRLEAMRIDYAKMLAEGLE